MRGAMVREKTENNERSGDKVNNRELTEEREKSMDEG